MIAPLLLALVAAADGSPRLSASVEIAGESSCPSPDMVRAALDALDSPAPARRARVTVRERDGGLLLEFAWEGGGPTDTRALVVPSGCDARAQAAAVVVATWLGRLPPAPAATAPVLTAPAVAPAPVGVAPPPTTDAPRWWLGVGLGATAGGGVAPAARVELARARPGGAGVGWIASLQAPMPRNQSIGGGTSRWLRTALGLAGALGWRLGAVGLAVDLGPLAAIAIAWGEGYPTDQADQALVFGLSAGLRAQFGAGPSRPWVEVRLIDWLGTQRLRFDTPGTEPITADLPTVEGMLILGWSLPLS
jgi:hypothetical protein